MPIVKTLTIVDARYLEQVRQFWIENNYMKCLSITIDRQLWLTLVEKFKASLEQSQTLTMSLYKALAFRPPRNES